MDLLLIFARGGLALVFIAAGVGKLLDQIGSRQALTDFGVPARWSVPGAWLLPSLELAVAAALLAQPLARAGAVGALVLLAVFVAGVANALRQGRAPDCHCFGQLHSSPASRWTIARNVALAAPAMLVVVAGPGDALAGTSSEGAALIAVSALAVALAVAVVLLVRGNRILLQGGSAAPTPLEVGTAAPELRLSDAQGSPLAVADIIDPERPTVLVFVEPACAACEALVPRVERWRVALAERVKVVVINSGRASRGGPKPEDAAAASATLWDIENAAFEAYRLRGAPSAVQVDRTGVIAGAPAMGGQAIEALIRVAGRRFASYRSTVSAA